MNSQSLHLNLYIIVFRYKVQLWIPSLYNLLVWSQQISMHMEQQSWNWHLGKILSSIVWSRVVFRLNVKGEHFRSKAFRFYTLEMQHRKRPTKHGIPELGPWYLKACLPAVVKPHSQRKINCFNLENSRWKVYLTFFLIFKRTQSPIPSLDI